MDFTLAYYKNFDTLKAVTRWAGIIGVLQSLIWIGLTITGILAYNCVIDYNDSNINYGSITMFTFYYIYFKGNCLPMNFPSDLNFDIVNKAGGTTLTPTQLFIWICVYLAISVCWLLSSTLLITNIKHNKLGLTNVILYMWVFITLGISSMDVAQGVIYGLDYNKFMTEAYNYNLAESQAGEVAQGAVILISAQIASMAMMVIAFRGFVLWIINVGLLCYLFKETFVINEAVNSEDSLFPEYSKDSNSILATRAPISAYDTTRSEPMAVSNPAYEPDRTGTIRINLTSAERAARMSTDNLQQRRLRNLDNFEQYPPTRSSPPRSSTDPSFPPPDYTPPMPRASHTQNAQLKNTRFQ